MRCWTHPPFLLRPAVLKKEGGKKGGGREEGGKSFQKRGGKGNCFRAAGKSDAALLESYERKGKKKREEMNIPEGGGG